MNRLTKSGWIKCYVCHWRKFNMKMAIGNFNERLRHVLFESNFWIVERSISKAKHHKICSFPQMKWIWFGFALSRAIDSYKNIWIWMTISWDIGLWMCPFLYFSSFSCVSRKSWIYWKWWISRLPVVTEPTCVLWFYWIIFCKTKIIQ